MKKYTILIAGGSGLIGQRLKFHFEKLNHRVHILSRNNNSDFYWLPSKKELNPIIFKKVDCIINLCGSPIDKRWSEKVKQEIYSSRIETTKFLIQTLNANKHNIKHYIGLSAIGYYNYSKNQKTENSNNGSHFLAKVCADWELEVLKLKNIKSTIFRTGVVLSNQGGMLKNLLFPFSINLGVKLGSGTQKVSWIHIDDLCSIFIFCIKNQKYGIFNTVSPFPISNNVLSQTLAQTFQKNILLPNIPEKLLKILFGEMSEIILKNSWVSSQKIQDAGYVFKFPKIKKALSNLLH